MPPPGIIIVVAVVIIINVVVVVIIIIVIIIIHSCRLQGSNIEVFCLHPGIIASGLSRHMGLLKYTINYGLYFFSKSTEQVWYGSAALLTLYSQTLLG